ncbi:MAG: hypothetical protein KY442_02390 [Proteobacteria bacterium]|nr:hypothetical protein [Pseudomonadota bacterium]
MALARSCMPAKPPPNAAAAIALAAAISITTSSISISDTPRTVFGSREPTVSALRVGAPPRGGRTLWTRHPIWAHS